MLLKHFTPFILVSILLVSSGAAFQSGPIRVPNQVAGTITLEVHVFNQYGGWYNGVEVQVFDDNPLSLVADGVTANGFYDATNLTSYSVYTVQVYAPNGANDSQTVEVQDNDAVLHFTLTSPSTPTLTVQNVTLNPSAATPGSPFSISADILNTSNSTAFNTVLSVTPPPQFSLLDTGSAVSIGVISPGESKPISLQLSVSSPTATPGFTLAYVLNFTDYAGVQYETPGSISLPIPPAPTLVIQTVSLDPTVIQPGATFSLTVVVANSSNSTAFNSILTLSPPAQFSLLNTGSVIPIGTLQPGANKSFTLDFIVSNSATAAASAIAYSLSYNDYFLNKGTTTGNLFVPVSGNPIQPKLIITTATFSESAIHPGDTFSAPIVIENVGNVTAYQVVLTINATSPIATTGSAGDYRLGNVPSQGAITVKLSFSSPSSAKLGSYPITMTLAYEDIFGTIYSSQQVLVATLVGAPSIVVNTFQFRINPLTPGLQTFLNVQLLNVGGESALNAKVTFQNAPSFLSNTTIFLGSIQPSGTGNATTFLQIPNNEPVGLYQFNVVVLYSDAGGNNYTSVEPYTVTVAPFSPPRVSVTNTLLSPEVLGPGTQGTMTIYLDNDGSSPANNITLTIVNGAQIFSSTYFGLGTLNPSSSGTTTVGVNVSPNLAGGSYILQIVAGYTDNNGVSYNSTFPLELTIYSSSSILSLKDVGMGLAVTIVGVAAYVGITYRKSWDRR